MQKQLSTALEWMAEKTIDNNQSVTACLGPHIKTLVVDGCPDVDALYGLMDLLSEHDCQEGLESLGKSTMMMA